MFGLNLVDLIIVLGLILYVLFHIEDGFLTLSGRLLGFVGSVVLAFSTYKYLSNFFLGYTALPPGLVDAGSFVLAFLVLQSVLIRIFERLTTFLPEKLDRSRPAKFLAVIPALLDGLIITALILLVLVITPLLPGVKAPIENSLLGRSLVERSSGAERYIDKIFGQATEEALGFLTIKPEAGESLTLPFEAKNLSIDGESEVKMFELVNRERAKVGVPALVMDEDIRQVARGHSEDMWRRKFFAHENPDGEDPFDRMLERGVVFRAAGENLALAHSVERAHSGLMNSEGHKRNILDPAFRRVGIGVIDGGIYGKMFTQNFSD